MFESCCQLSSEHRFAISVLFRPNSSTLKRPPQHRRMLSRSTGAGYRTDTRCWYRYGGIPKLHKEGFSINATEIKHLKSRHSCKCYLLKLVWGRGVNFISKTKAEKLLMVHHVNLAACLVCFVDKASLQYKQQMPIDLAPPISTDCDTEGSMKV